MPTTSRFKRLIIGSGLTGTDNGDNTITITAGGGGGGTSPSDTAGWMPLTTVVGALDSYGEISTLYSSYSMLAAADPTYADMLGGGPELVWDADNDLIPTYGPF